MAWMNNDGLYIKYGPEEGAVGKAGQYAEGITGQNIVEVRIPDMTALSTSETYILDDNVFLPEGYRVQKVELVVDTAVTGANALLCVGTIGKDRATGGDADGFIIDGAVATLAAAGNTVEYTQGSTAHGALIGTDIAAPCYIVAFEGDANAFTAGAVTIRIFLQKL
jgi:hypothetical protein